MVRKVSPKPALREPKGPKAAGARDWVGGDARLRHMDFVCDSLCSLRAMANELELPFLGYLIEMAALQARHDALMLRETHSVRDARSAEK